MANPLGKIIKDPKGRQFVIPDIHGCFKTLEALIKQIDLRESDHLYFLGDYVNKGPHSLEVLKFIIDLKKYRSVFPLLGNHDLLLLDYLNSKSEVPFGEHSLNYSSLTVDDRTEISRFLEELHHYFILDRFILVHAGLNFNLTNPFLGLEEILNIRHFHYDSNKAQNKTIIHGHYPHAFSEIESAINKLSKIIPLDNGCVYAGERDGMGRLLCLELKSMELFIQEKLD